MPYAIVIEVVPVTALPPELGGGRNVHALVLDLVGRECPEMSRAMHDAPMKPFATAPIRPMERTNGAIPSGTSCRLRVTLLDDRLYPIVAGACRRSPLLRLGNVEITLVRMLSMPDNSSPEIDYATYPAIWDTAETGPSVIRLSFRTPTAISAGDADLPLPVPAKLWTGYAARWRTFAPDVPLPDELDEGLERWLRLSDYDIRPARWRYSFPDGKGGTRLYTHLGCLGWIEVTLDRKATPAFIRAARALAAYSFYAGSGMKTTMGMGQTVPELGGRRREEGFTAEARRTRKT